MILLAEMQLGSFICLSLVVVVTFFALGGMMRRREPSNAPRAKIVPAPRLREPTPPPEVWEARLREVARELTARLDNKATSLNELCRTAEQRIAKLEALLATPEAPTPAAEPMTPRRQEPTTQAAGLTRTDNAPANATGRAPVRGPTRRMTDPTRHAKIYALADDGHPIETIAALVGTPLGEVELILGLRPQE